MCQDSIVQNGVIWIVFINQPIVSTTYSQIFDLTFETYGPNFLSEDIYRTLSAPSQPAYPQIFFQVCSIVWKSPDIRWTLCCNEKDVIIMVGKNLCVIDWLSDFKCLISNVIYWQLFRVSSVDFWLMHKSPNSELSETARYFSSLASHIPLSTTKEL